MRLRNEPNPGDELIAIEQIMSSKTPNPYTPSMTSQRSAAKTRWRILPAAGSFAIGIASLLFLFWMVTALPSPRTTGPILNQAAVYAFYLAFGGTWILAGWFYWRRLYWYGLAANGTGILFVVMIRMMFGL